MSVVYATALKTARLEQVVDFIDAGSGPGKLQIGTAAMALVLAEITLDHNPAGTVVTDLLTLASFPKSDSSANASGAAAAARIRDSDDNDVVTGLTVGLVGTDVILDSLSITAGQQITITAATIQHG
jgi:hypothetical protein